MNKKLFCIIGRTSSGKTSLAKEVAKQLNLKVVKSYTTRPLKPGEIEKESDHYFISEEEYPNYKNDIVAYTEINGYRYFTTSKELSDADLYVIDPKGYFMLSGKISSVECLKDTKLIPIYVTTSYDISKKRASARGDDLKAWEERGKSENYILEYSLNVYMINNDGHFLDSVGNMKNIIIKEQGS